MLLKNQKILFAFSIEINLFSSPEFRNENLPNISEIEWHMKNSGYGFLLLYQD